MEEVIIASVLQVVLEEELLEGQAIMLHVVVTQVEEVGPNRQEELQELPVLTLLLEVWGKEAIKPLTQVIGMDQAVVEVTMEVGQELL